jgi:hypothetical protein
MQWSGYRHKYAKPLFPRKINLQRTTSSICLPADVFMNDAG